MIRCNVVFFTDGQIQHVTLEHIEEYAEKRGMNVTWGRGNAGELTRKDGVTPCRYFVGSYVEE